MCERGGILVRVDSGLGVLHQLTGVIAVQQGDSWVVTEQVPGKSGPGQTVLAPTT